VVSTCAHIAQLPGSSGSIEAKSSKSFFVTGMDCGVIWRRQGKYSLRTNIQVRLVFLILPSTPQESMHESYCSIRRQMAGHIPEQRNGEQGLSPSIQPLASSGQFAPWRCALGGRKYKTEHSHQIPHPIHRGSFSLKREARFLRPFSSSGSRCSTTSWRVILVVVTDRLIAAINSP